MAEGFLKHIAGDRFEVFSAGVKPEKVNPMAVKVMAEQGIDISEHTSKSVRQFSGQNFDYVITVCDNAKKSCPVFSGKHEKIHWGLEDPAMVQGTEKEVLKEFRKILDQIKIHILSFLETH